MELTRLKKRTLAKLVTKFPSLVGSYLDSYKPKEFSNVPWTPVTKNLCGFRVAIVTGGENHGMD